MKKIFFIVVSILFIWWGQNITFANYQKTHTYHKLSTNKKTMYAIVVTKKLLNIANKKQNKVAYIQNIIYKIDKINTKLQNSPKYRYNPKYQDIVEILKKVKLNLKNYVADNIINYLNNSNYTEFDKTILKAQQTYLVKLIDILLKKISDEQAYKMDVNASFSSTNPQLLAAKANLKLKNFEINKKWLLTSANGEIELQNMYISVNTILSLIKDDEKGNLYIKFDKLDLGGLVMMQQPNAEEKIKKILWKYILISKNNSRENPIESITKLRNILNTKPLVREVPAKYTWKNKNILIPTKAMFEIDKIMWKNLWKSEEELLKESILKELGKTENTYYTKSGNGYIIKENSNNNNYILLNNNWRITEISSKNDHWYLIYKDWKIELNGEDKDGAKVKLSWTFDVENENINLTYDYSDLDKDGYIKVIYNKWNLNIEINIKKDNEKIFELKWNGILKEWKNNFKANGKIYTKDYYTNETKTASINFSIKDTPVSINKYNETIKITLNDGKYDYNLDVNWKIEKLTPKAIQIPKNYITEDELSNQ